MPTEQQDPGQRRLSFQGPIFDNLQVWANASHGIYKSFQHWKVRNRPNNPQDQPLSRVYFDHKDSCHPPSFEEGLFYSNGMPLPYLIIPKKCL